MADGTREGGCACGAVRYRATGEPIFVNNCHCTLCQNQTGATSAVNAFYETEALALLSGETARTVVKTGSGGEQAIVRCTACGTALWSHYPGLGEYGLALRAGTLAEPGSVTPDAVIYVADKMPWVALPDGIPQFATTYKPSAVLPPERFARLLAVVNKNTAQAERKA
ncbi:MAG: GFA family protein [Sphingobium sp.]